MGRRNKQMLCFFLPQTYNNIDYLQYVSDEDIFKFQGVIGQLPDDFSDDFREFAFYFIDQEGFEMYCIRMFRSIPFLG